MQKNKIFYLESLRGLAAISVAIFHFDNGSFLNNSFTKNGWLMVDFFFILSGTVISLNYQEKIQTFSDILKFQFKRFLRLYPLHILMLLIFLIIEMSKYLIKLEFGIVSNNPPFSVNNSETFFLNILLLHNLFSDYLTWNVQSWSISAEFYTYLIYAFLALYIFKNKLSIYFISSIIVIIAFILLFKSSMEPSNGFLRCLYSFFLGVIIFNLSNLLKYKINFPSYFLLFISILAVCYSEGEKVIGLNIFIPFIFSAFVFSLLISNDENLIKEFLNKRSLIYLGTISYGIYMVHTAVWWVINQSLRFFFNFETFVNKDGATKVVFDNLFLANLTMFFGLSVIFVLSHYSYKFVEMPINNKKNKINLSK